jgi:outer membrane receptor protein involved in Fe transport
VSRACQIAPVGIRFLDAPLLNGLAQATGHEGMRSTGLVAYELGHRTKIFDRIETDCNVFWNEYRNMQTMSPGLGPPSLVRMNLRDDSSASLYGAELETKYKATRNLTFLGNYTFERPDWRSRDPYVMMDAMSPPAHKFMLGTQYSPLKRLRLSEYLYYVDTVKAPNPTNPLVPRHVPTHFRLDLRAEYEVLKDRASVAVGVSDLLDGNHYEGGTMFLNNAQVPRMIYAELRMTFR